MSEPPAKPPPPPPLAPPRNPSTSTAPEGVIEESASDINKRRSGDRATITLKVDYKRLNTFFADYTKNISKGGTFIRTTKPLEVGTAFVFALTVPEPKLDNAGVRLELTGEVKWVVREADATPTSPAGMGIQFIFKDESESERVERFVSDMMRSSLGDVLADKLLGR